jgi:hypothetical protein
MQVRDKATSRRLQSRRRLQVPTSDDIHLFNEKLREGEDYHDYHRPHGALDGQTPYERLLMKTGAEVLPRP